MKLKLESAQPAVSKPSLAACTRGYSLPVSPFLDCINPRPRSGIQRHAHTPAESTHSDVTQTEKSLCSSCSHVGQMAPFAGQIFVFYKDSVLSLRAFSEPQARWTFGGDNAPIFTVSLPVPTPCLTWPLVPPVASADSHLLYRCRWTRAQDRGREDEQLGESALMLPEGWC